MQIVKTAISVGVFLLWIIHDAVLYAYSQLTHEAITQRAIQPTVSSVDGILKDELGLIQGREQQIMGYPIQTWVGRGAFWEDEPGRRALNHFHNPLLPWPSAGLSIANQSGLSSTLWQQYQGHQDLFFFPFEGGGDFSWRDARQRFFSALTNPSSERRERDFAGTFVTLGHLMHLIQDASVPEHTRNDTHRLWSGYESWVNTIQLNRPELFQQLLTLALLPSPTIFTPTNSTEAPVPIARLIDTDTFSGLDGTVLTGDTIGMAEYTNGNFVSDNTIFTPDFLLPRPQSLGPGFFEPEGQSQRQYFSKVGAGEQVTHFVAEGVWQDRLQRLQTAVGDYVLTDRVFEDYARKLLPRAVGYSAALIDYFFRGKIDLAPDTAPQTPGDYLIKNLGTEDLDGTFTLYYDDADGNRSPVNGGPWPLIIPAGRSVAAPAFNFPLSPPTYLLVFQGTMGQEASAVAAKQVENTPPMVVFSSDGNAYRSVAEGFGYEWTALPGWGEKAGSLLQYGILTGIMINAEWMLLDGYPLHWVNGQWEWADLSTSDTPDIWDMDSLGGKELVGGWCSDNDLTGCGIVYSADFGQSWQFRSSFSSTGVDTPNFIRAIGNGEIAMGLQSWEFGPWRVYRSNDHGSWWSEMAMPEGSSSWLAYNMVWNQRDGAERVLLAYGWAGSTLAVWKSTDGGEHWKPVWVSDIYSCYEEVNSLAMSPDGRALMTTSNCSGGPPLLYWSVDAGETWTVTEPLEEAPTNHYGVMSLDYYRPAP